MANDETASFSQGEMIHTLRNASSGLFREYGAVFAGLLLLQLITYSYFFTSLIFTNHTFPNSWVFPYPSFKTRGEGRWLADFIIWVQGGSGVQPFQMFVATALQGINSILFARFLGLEKRSEVFLAAAFLCLYPAFLDYYSFAIDHITFTVGDTFALLGVLYWQKSGHSPRVAAVSGLLFVLTLASYQPKVALIGLLCVCYLALSIAGRDETRQCSPKDAMLAVAYISCVFFGSCLVYFLSTKLTISYDIGARAHLNSVQDMLGVASTSYGRFIRYYTVGADYLPNTLRFLPGLGILLGCFALLRGAYRKHLAAVAMVALLLLLMPVVLRTPYIINRNAWEDEGRLLSANGYALLFFLSCALQAERMKAFALGVLMVCLYSFVVVGTQESNAAALKTIYDLSTINRIVSRIETVADDLYERRYALIVAGYYPEFVRSRYVRKPNSGNLAHIRTFAFEVYRQPEILNYFLGRAVLRLPTAAEMDRALDSARGRRPWPATESVYVLDDSIVVLLERYRPDMPRTWTREQFAPTR